MDFGLEHGQDLGQGAEGLSVDVGSEYGKKLDGVSSFFTGPDMVDYFTRGGWVPPSAALGERNPGRVMDHEVAQISAAAASAEILTPNSVMAEVEGCLRPYNNYAWERVFGDITFGESPLRGDPVVGTLARLLGTRFDKGGQSDLAFLMGMDRDELEKRGDKFGPAMLYAVIKSGRLLDLIKVMKDERPDLVVELDELLSADGFGHDVVAGVRSCGNGSVENLDSIVQIGVESSCRYNETVIAVKDLLTSRLGLKELKTVCFNLGIDFDNLVGRGKAQKVMALIEFLSNRGSLYNVRSGLEERGDLQVAVDKIFSEGQSAVSDLQDRGGLVIAPGQTPDLQGSTSEPLGQLSQESPLGHMGGTGTDSHEPVKGGVVDVRREIESEPEAVQITPVDIRERLESNYDVEEFRTLCQKLGVDYDNLRGEGKAARARELVGYCQRRGRLSELNALLSSVEQQVVKSEVVPAPRDAVFQLNSVQRTVLLESVFDEEELRSLCTKLDVEYDSVRGE